MRQITKREKAYISVGVLVAVAVFVWYVLLPLLEGGGGTEKISLEEMQGKLEAIQKLASEPLGPMLIDMEKKMSEQSGYGKMSFKRGSTDPAIINFIAQAAGRAEIRELDQLDAKLDTSKRSQTEVRSQQDILKSIVNQLYMRHVLNDAKQDTEAGDENAPVGGPPGEQSDSSEGSEGSPDVNNDSGTPQEDTTKPDLSEKPEPDEASGSMKQAELEESPLLFPPVPRDIPDKVKQLLSEFVKEHQGKTLAIADIDEIVDNAGINDEGDMKRIRKRLQDHSKRVKEVKDEITSWLGDAGVSQTSLASERVRRYIVKMVFKSKIDQLVRFLYDLQDSARWLRIDSMRIGISDRKETTLSVELSMTATAIYDL